MRSSSTNTALSEPPPGARKAVQGVDAPHRPPCGPYRRPDARHRLAPTHAPLGSRGPQTAVQGLQEVEDDDLVAGPGPQEPPQQNKSP